MIEEEPYVWEIQLSGSVRGRGTTEGMAEIWWHRRETRRQTEKTNVSLKPQETPVYSTIGAKPLSSRDYASVLFWHNSCLASEMVKYSLCLVLTLFLGKGIIMAEVGKNFWRLTAAAVAVIAAPGAISYVAWIYHKAFTDKEIAMAQYHMLMTAKAIARGIQEYIIECQENIQTLARNTLIRKALSEGKITPAME
jgi:hypothetical protein